MPSLEVLRTQSYTPDDDYLVLMVGVNGQPEAMNPAWVHEGCVQCHLHPFSWSHGFTKALLVYQAVRNLTSVGSYSKREKIFLEPPIMSERGSQQPTPQVGCGL